jgi:hypothetical protein
MAESVSNSFKVRMQKEIIKYGRSEADAAYVVETLLQTNQDLGLTTRRPDEHPDPSLATAALNHSTLLGMNNIYGIGIGEKEIENTPTGRAAIILYVVRKAPPEFIVKEFQAQNIGKRFINRIETDVVQLIYPSK